MPILQKTHQELYQGIFPRSLVMILESYKLLKDMQQIFEIIVQILPYLLI